MRSHALLGRAQAMLPRNTRVDGSSSSSARALPVRWLLEEPGPAVSWWAGRVSAPSAAAGATESWPSSLPSRRASPHIPSVRRIAHRPSLFPAGTVPERGAARRSYRPPLSSSLWATPGQPRHEQRGGRASPPSPPLSWRHRGLMAAVCLLCLCCVISDDVSFFFL